MHLQFKAVSGNSAATGCNNFFAPSIIPWNSTNNFHYGTEKNETVDWTAVGFDAANIIGTTDSFGITKCN